jgi:hypothetical protein
MITHNPTALLTLCRDRILHHHGEIAECDGPIATCDDCTLLIDLEIVLAAESDHRKPHVRGPVAQADQWPARDHEYDGRGRNHG